MRDGDWPGLRQNLQTIRRSIKFFVPRRISQSAQPAAGEVAEGELIIWHDSGNNMVYSLYNDKVEGIVKIELT